MIRAVFFDIGNTLFFYNYEFFSKMLMERFSIDIDARELEAIHYSLGEAIQKHAADKKDHHAFVKDVYGLWLEELAVDKEIIPDIIDAVRMHPFPHLFWSRMGDDVRETLTWLQEHGVKMGVISNATGQIQRLVEHAGLDDFFHVVLDSHVVGFEKPDARIFEKALKELGVKPDEAVHVGDLVGADIDGARAAGITPVLVDRENRYQDVGCLRVKTVGELVTLPLFKNHR